MLSLLVTLETARYAMLMADLLLETTHQSAFMTGEPAFVGA
jgi:hypothetical protein